MGHGGMLYSLPSRDLIADSVEYMVNAHVADGLVCISNCDKITPGMLMAALEINAFMDTYQPQVLSNAKAFAKALANEGLEVQGLSLIHI